MRYTTTRRAHLTQEIASFWKARASFPPFANDVREQAYALLAANGLLDRPRALSFMREVEEALKAYAKPLPRGHFRRDELWLDKDKLGGHLTLRQSREGGR